MRNYSNLTVGQLAVKPDVVRVIRYFRVWDMKNEQIASYGGMTAICHLNYSTKEITVHPAFCDYKDNFSKAVGLRHAEQAEKDNVGFFVPLNQNWSIYQNITEAWYLGTGGFLNGDSEDSFKAPLTRWAKEIHAAEL